MCIEVKMSAMAVAIGLTVCLHVRNSQAAVHIDITFEAGAMPADFGFGERSSASDNIADGEWTNTRLSGQEGAFHFFESGALGTQPNARSIIDDLEGPWVHGTAEITLLTLPTNASFNLADQFVIDITDSKRDFRFSVGWIDNSTGNVVLRHLKNQDDEGDPGHPTNQDVYQVAWSDGEKHTVGWELHIPTTTVNVYFDDLTEGNEIGSNTLRNFDWGGLNEGTFGDSSSGRAHSEIFHRWTLSEGRIPEPATLALVLPGVGFLLTRHRNS